MRRQQGLTLVELLVTTTISLLVFAGLSGVVRATLNNKTLLDARAELTREASFALERMVRTVAHTRQLVLPQSDVPSTNWPENIREQTVPASPPIGDSVLATAALSMALPADVDLNFDGVPDADNDGDGRIDEDFGQDMNRDGVAGIRGIDDGGDGWFDNVNWWDDDERNGVGDEDPIDGIDNDGDGQIDEDSGDDMNADGEPGIAGVDDDGDGTVDEGDNADDDEDGSADEDWLDTVTYFLSDSTLIERMPVPWDETGAGGVTGWDYIESPIADGVTLLRFERIEQNDNVLVNITIELTGADGEIVSLQQRVRVGGAL